MRRHDAQNAGLVALVVLTQGYQALLPWSLARAGLSGATLCACLAAGLAPLVALHHGLWSLTHEAIHRNLFRARAANELGGALVGVAFGSSFTLLRQAHMTHHKHSRTSIERAEVAPDEARARSPFVRAAYLARLLGGLYLSELVGPVVSLLPVALVRGVGRAMLAPGGYAAIAFERMLAKPSTVWRIRLEAALAAAWVALQGSLYGARWPFLAGLVLARAAQISLSDYAYHYATPVDDPRAARNLALPAWASALMLHFNLHGAHHRYPRARWQELPAIFRSKYGAHDATFAGAVLAQLRGPLSPDSLRDEIARQAPLFGPEEEKTP